MSLTRTALISQFSRDCQSLRDALIGLTHSQLSDESFHPSWTLRSRLSLVAAHYFRLGEAIAHRLHRQADAPLDEDERWRKEAVDDRADWPLADLQSDLEDAWEYYREMIDAMTDDEIEWYVRHIDGALTRVAFDASREVSAWRLRSGG